jgi:hypothetical protein
MNGQFLVVIYFKLSFSRRVPPVSYRVHATSTSTASKLKREADALEEAVVWNH